MLCESQICAISRRSFIEKALAECARIFKCSIPKYMEFAPACMAAARLSREPTGAIISKSSLLIIILLFAANLLKKKETTAKRAGNMLAQLVAPHSLFVGLLAFFLFLH